MVRLNLKNRLVNMYHNFEKIKEQRIVQGGWIHMDVSVSLITLPYLLFGPELIKHLLDLHTPVVLHAVKGVLGHGRHHCLLDG